MGLQTEYAPANEFLLLISYFSEQQKNNIKKRPPFLFFLQTASPEKTVPHTQKETPILYVDMFGQPGMQ